MFRTFGAMPPIPVPEGSSVGSVDDSPEQLIQVLIWKHTKRSQTFMAGTGKL